MSAVVAKARTTVPGANLTKNQKKRMRVKKKQQKPGGKPQVKNAPAVKQMKLKKKQGVSKGFNVLSNGLKVNKSDFRNGAVAKNASKKLIMANVQSSLAFDVAVPAQVFVPVAASFVSWALQKGWMATTASTSSPFLAFGYLYQILQSYALNTVSGSVTVPKCIAFIGQGLTQKIVRARNGHVTYKFTFAQDTAPSPTYMIGPSNNVNWNLFVPTGGNINVVWQTGGPPTAYTDSLGATAWTSLLQFLAQSETIEKTSMLELVPANSINKMTRDVSAFAVTYSDPGGGWGGVGGFGRQAYMEVPIHSPPMSVFNTVPNAGIFDLNRYARFTVSAAGDAMLLGAFASIFKEKWFGMKIPIAFKCIDINQFIEVYALVLSKALYLVLNDPQQQAILNSYTTLIDLEGYAQSFICPLSLQEFGFLIRATMMNCLKDTQVFVQSIYPRQADDAGENLFTACTASANTCALPGTTPMLVPLILAENMRACTYSIIENGINGRNPYIAMPILGAYSEDVLDTEDYGAIYGSTLFPDLRLPTFIPDPPISLSIIDGTSTGGAVAFVNDPAVLNMLIDKFNQWLKDSQVAGFMSKLISIGTDAGPTVLTNMNLTQHWIPVPVEQKKTNKLRKDFYKDLADYTRVKRGDKTGKSKLEKPVPSWKLTPNEERFGVTVKDRHLSTSPYAAKQEIAVTFNSDPYSDVWETIQQYFVKPVNNAVSESNLNTSDQVFRMGAQNQEFNVLNPSVASSNNFLTLVQLNDQLAQLMVDPRNTDVKGGVFQDLLDNIEKTGRGGIFNDIVSAFDTGARVIVPLATAALGAYGRKGLMPN